MDILFFIASKIVYYLLLPPGVFIVLFLFLSYRIKSKIKYIGIATAFTVYIFSTEVFYDMMFKKIDFSIQTNIENNTSIGAIVVLGLGVSESSPSFQLPAESLKNLLYGMYLSAKYHVPLVFSGKGTKELSESEACKNTIKKISSIHKNNSLLPNGIYFENKSLNTYENAKYTKKILSDISVNKKDIILVTSYWHMKRAKKAFDEFNIKTIPMPTEYSAILKNKQYNFLSFLPTMEYLASSHTKIKEFLGKIALWIKRINI